MEAADEGALMEKPGFWLIVRKYAINVRFPATFLHGVVSVSCATVVLGKNNMKRTSWLISLFLLLLTS